MTSVTIARSILSLELLKMFVRSSMKPTAIALKVIIDQVWSHTSDQHPWFLESRKSCHNRHTDWYVWHDPGPDDQPPSNWLSTFGGSAWTWEPQRRQYYLHHFLKEQPALNWRNQEVSGGHVGRGALLARHGRRRFSFRRHQLSGSRSELPRQSHSGFQVWPCPTGPSERSPSFSS